MLSFVTIVTDYVVHLCLINFLHYCVFIVLSLGIVDYEYFWLNDKVCVMFLYKIIYNKCKHKWINVMILYNYNKYSLSDFIE